MENVICCLNCTHRSPNCHSTCEQYIKESAEVRETHRLRAESRSTDKYVNDLNTRKNMSVKKSRW